MDRLLLVRHAEPEIDVEIPASEWKLTSRGIVSTTNLAPVLAGFEPSLVVTSPERKAIETARVLADALQLPVHASAHFAEQGAGAHEFIEDYGEFQDMVRRYFEQPDEVVMRREAAVDAAKRFAQGVRELAGRDGTVVLVTHGRILSSWLADWCGVNALDVWTALRMPDAMDVDLERRTFRPLVFSLF